MDEAIYKMVILAVNIVLSSCPHGPTLLTSADYDGTNGDLTEHLLINMRANKPSTLTGSPGLLLSLLVAFQKLSKSLMKSHMLVSTNYRFKLFTLCLLILLTAAAAHRHLVMSVTYSIAVYMLYMYAM